MPFSHTKKDRILRMRPPECRHKEKRTTLRVPTSRRISPKGWLQKGVAHGAIQRKRCSTPQKSVGRRRKAAPKPERPTPPEVRGAGREDVRRFFGAVARLCNATMRFCRQPESRQKLPALILTAQLGLKLQDWLYS